MQHLTPSVHWCCWLSSRKGIWPVKNWVVGCWRGYLSWMRCRLAHGPADATATHCPSLASVKSRLVLPFWYRLTRVVPDERPLNVRARVGHEDDESQVQKRCYRYCSNWFVVFAACSLIRRHVVGSRTWRAGRPITSYRHTAVPSRQYASPASSFGCAGCCTSEHCITQLTECLCWWVGMYYVSLTRRRAALRLFAVTADRFS